MSERKSGRQESAAAVQQKAKQGAVIYLGPPIAGLAVPGTVYQNGGPHRLSKAAEKEPALKRLLVATGDAQRVRKELRDPQSAAGICYQRAAEYMKKEGAKG